MGSPGPAESNWLYNKFNSPCQNFDFFYFLLDDITCFYPQLLGAHELSKSLNFSVIYTTSSLKQCDRLAIDYSGNKVKYEWYNSSGLLGNDRKSNDPRSGYVRRLRFRSTLGPFFDPFSPFDPFNSPDFTSVLCSTLVSVVRGSFWVLSIFNTEPKVRAHLPHHHHTKTE